MVLMIRCPKTGNPVPTGIGMDKAALETAPLERSTLSSCPECGEEHAWTKSDAFDS